MPRLTISAPGMEANPMAVMQLLRALGTRVREITELLSQNAPLIDEELPDPPTAPQINRIRQFLQVLERAAVRPRVMLDGREIQLRALNEEFEAAEKMRGRVVPADGGAV